MADSQQQKISTANLDNQRVVKQNPTALDECWHHPSALVLLAPSQCLSAVGTDPVH